MDARYARGYQDSLQDMVVCVLEGMTPETKELAESMSNGGFASFNLSEMWDFFCYMGHQVEQEEAFTRQVMLEQVLKRMERIEEQLKLIMLLIIKD